VGAPPYVRGLCIIRGAAVPVADTGVLIGEQATKSAVRETAGTAPQVDRSKRRTPTRLSRAVTFGLRVACFMPRGGTGDAAEIWNQQRKAEGLWIEMHFASSEPI
jgi:hypothetical protein